MDRLAKETADQQQFREDMEAAGYEVRTYSGRGMYGRETYGVSCDRQDGPTAQEVYRATSIELCEDQLGLGTILYVG